MAYKQNPGRGNNSKTGHGIPTPFKQMETIKKIGSKIAEGAKAIDSYMKEGSSSDSRYGGSQDRFLGVQLAGKNAGKYEGNNPKTSEKKKSPVKQTKKKEKRLIDTVSDYASDAYKSVKKTAYKIGQKAENFTHSLEGNNDTSDTSSNNDTMFGVRLSGPRAFNYDATKNPLSSEYKKSPTKQLKSKKTSAKVNKY